MTARVWFGLLSRNRFAVSPRQSLMILDVTLVTIVNSALGAMQRLLYGQRIARMPIACPPVFILGHWRTGSTLLHELLALDERFVAPTTYECLVPSHALLTGPISILSSIRLPRRRPMDGMAVGWTRPQEDECALMNLGAGSIYETFAFPNHRPVRGDFINPFVLPEAQRMAWIAARIGFMRQVLYRRRRSAWWRRTPVKAHTLLLKSPHDTARIADLTALFPGAQFIHLVRNPEIMFASTVRFWQTIAATQACQSADWRALPNGAPSIEDFVLANHERLYRNFARERDILPDTQFIDLRYEDLANDPISALARIYEHFGWDGFAVLRPKLDAHLRAVAHHQPNHHVISAASKAAVAERWSEYRARYGYG